MLSTLPLLVAAVAIATVAGLRNDAVTASTSCRRLTVRDTRAGQDIRLEAHGADAIRVRAVTLGETFRDDLISALLPVPNGDGVDEAADAHPNNARAPQKKGADCAAIVDLAVHEHSPLTFPPSLTNGNLRVAVGADGRLTFTRVSDNFVLLREKTVRVLAPAEGLPVPGFSTLDLSFEAVAGEKIYGLGQHAKLAWDKTGSAQGQLDNKGVRGLLLAPHDGEILIPVAHSSLGYAFLFNLPAPGNVEYNSSVSYWCEAAVQ